MSLTSCFEYIIELPVATLNGMLTAALSEADASGVQTSVHQDNVNIGTYTATVDAQLDLTTNPPVLTLTAANLGLNLHLHMNAQVTVNGIANLDPITYGLEFDFPGVFQKQPVTPPILVMLFPGLSAPQLNLNVTGGNVDLTPALIKPQVDAMYAANPSLAQTIITGVNIPTIGTVSVIVDIYDTIPGPLSGQITVTVPDATHVVLNMPGHMLVQDISSTKYIDSDINILITVGVVQADGSITAKVSAVAAADVTVTFVTASIYNSLAAPLVAAQVATKIDSLGDIVVTTPTKAQVTNAITQQLIQYASNLTIPVFTSTPPADPANDMDLTTFVPMTILSQALALQLQQQPVACDTPDLFFNGSEFAVSMDAAKCNSIIQPVVDAENAAPPQNIQGHSVSFSGITATLEDPGAHGVAAGHIWLAGTATVHLTCWPDSHINFSGPITLTPAMDTSNNTVSFDPVPGAFTADNPCCGSVDPGSIATFIQSQQHYPPVQLPTQFAGVGQININITAVDIFAAGMVLRGDLSVVTTHSLHKSQIQHNTFWNNEPPAGG